MVERNPSERRETERRVVDAPDLKPGTWDSTPVSPSRDLSPRCRSEEAPEDTEVSSRTENAPGQTPDPQVPSTDFP